LLGFLNLFLCCKYLVYLLLNYPKLAKLDYFDINKEPQINILFLVLEKFKEQLMLLSAPFSKVRNIYLW
jgi:hypothetical protein